MSTDASPVPAPPQGSTLFMRWVAPVSLILLGAALSFWLQRQLPAIQTKRVGRYLALTLMPGAAAVTLIGVRTFAGRMSRSGDMMLTWFVTFLIGLHVLVVGAIVGRVQHLEIAVPCATGMLFMGLGPAVRFLEPGSAMGVRVRATLGSAEIWRKVHALLGNGFAFAGMIALALAFYRPWLAVVLLAAAPIAALVLAVLYARELERKALLAGTGAAPSAGFAQPPPGERSDLDRNSS